MELIKNFLLGILMIMIFIKLMDMILPENKLKNYVEFLMGVIALIVVSSPIINAFSSAASLEIPNVDDYYDKFSNGVLQLDTGSLDKLQEKQVLDIYESTLETTIKSTLDNMNLNNSSDFIVTCEVEKQDALKMGEINKITVRFSESDKEVKQNIANKIINAIVNTYNVRQEQVVIE